MSNIRRTAKGPPFFKLPTGAVRYRADAVNEWMLSGERGMLTVERVALAIAACSKVPIEHRAAIIAHLESAFLPMDGREAKNDDGDEPKSTTIDKIAPALALLKETKAELAVMEAELLQAPAAPAKRKRERPRGK